VCRCNDTVASQLPHMELMHSKHSFHLHNHHVTKALLPPARALSSCTAGYFHAPAGKLTVQLQLTALRCQHSQRALYQATSTSHCASITPCQLTHSYKNTSHHASSLQAKNTSHCASSHITPCQLTHFTLCQLIHHTMPAHSKLQTHHTVLAHSLHCASSLILHCASSYITPCQLIPSYKHITLCQLTHFTLCQLIHHTIPAHSKLQTHHTVPAHSLHCASSYITPCQLTPSYKHISLCQHHTVPAHT